SMRTFVPSAEANALIASAGDDIALRLAERIPVGAIGVLDYAFCASPTLRAAIRGAQRHYGLISERIELKLSDAGGVATIELVRRPGTAIARQWVEMSAAMLVIRMRQTLARPPVLTAVSFAHP